MANYILKRFNARMFNIDYNRKTIGMVTAQEDGTWSARLVDGDNSAKVSGFATSNNAFYAVAHALKVFALNKRARTNIIPLTQGTGNEVEEIEHRNRTVAEYVAAYNAYEGRQAMRVVTRRR
jgi:hypothetical protein